MSGTVSTVFANPWGLPLDDLDEGLEVSHDDLLSLRGSRVLITGGTGFLGSWLVSSLLHADEKLKLGLELSLVTRNPAALPVAGRRGVSIIESDVRDLSSVGAVDFIVHGAASSSSGSFGDGEPRVMADTIYRGTQAVLEVAGRSSARVLFLSSGAVYGRQFAPVPESCMTGPDSLDPSSAYGQAKRLAETLCVTASRAGDCTSVIARLFAFVGPRLPLDAHYAAGNFLADAIAGRTIRVNGDGRPKRSYLYVGDLPQWCWALLHRGKSECAYNVGSKEVLSIEELARRVARLPGEPVAVNVRGSSAEGPAPWYVPDVSVAANNLGLVPRNDIAESLRKSFEWYSALAV